MPDFINAIVFQPPREPASLATVRLHQVRRYLRYVEMPGGEQLHYLHMKAARRRPSPFFAQSPWRDDLTHYRTQVPQVILYNHGNAEDLGGCYAIVRWLSNNLGVDVLAYDYRGYGFSRDPRLKEHFNPSEKSVFEDADLIYSTVLHLGYSPSQVIVMGRSVGGGPACYLAEKHHTEIGGLILESTFTSCMHVVSSCCIPFCFPYWNMFENKKRVERTTSCPVLFMHGDCDDVVPFHCSLELLDTAVTTRKKIKVEVDKAYSKSSMKQVRRSVTVVHDPADPPTSSGSLPPATGRVSVREHPMMAPAAAPQSIRSTGASRLNDAQLLTPVTAAASPSSPMEFPVREEAADQPACDPSSPPPRTIRLSQTEELDRDSGDSIYEPLLHKKKVRSYNRAADLLDTEEERLGLFSYWFAGRNHNDIEKTEEALFLNIMDRYLEIAARTSPRQQPAPASSD